MAKMMGPRKDGSSAPLIVVNDLVDGVLAFEEEDEAQRAQWRSRTRTNGPPPSSKRAPSVQRMHPLRAANAPPLSGECAPSEQRMRPLRAVNAPPPCSECAPSEQQMRPLRASNAPPLSGKCAPSEQQMRPL
eukprot:4860478-Pyramimonas_sp.AAC.1